jgi:ADP-ribosylglycohydrolase
MAAAHVRGDRRRHHRIDLRVRPDQNQGFPLFGAGTAFTDDTVCTVAIADCILEEGEFAAFLKDYGRRYPGRGYGGWFARWLASDELAPYGSFGNGAAMRVCPVARLAHDEAQALDLARRSAAATHDHPRGIAGAQATALAMWRAREGAPPEAIRSEIAARFGYDLGRSVETIRKPLPVRRDLRRHGTRGAHLRARVRQLRGRSPQRRLARRRRRHARLYHWRARRATSWVTGGRGGAGEGASRSGVAATGGALLWRSREDSLI